MTILELESELKKQKRKKYITEWDRYLDKLESFAKSLVGKVIVKWSAKDSFYMFKIEGYKITNYFGMDSEPMRWIELKIDCHLSCNVYSTRKSMRSTEWGTHLFIEKKGKKSKVKEWNYVEGIGCNGFIARSIELGKTQVDSAIQSPDYDNSYLHFMQSAFILDDASIYEEALAIYSQHAVNVANYWIKNAEKFKNLPRLKGI